MSVSTFLQQLQKLDIKLWVEGEKLRVNAPKGVLTSDLKAQLVARKPQIISFLQSAATAQSGDLPPVRKLTRPAHIPLSFSQQRLWFLSQLDPDNVAYNIPVVIQFHGRLDETAVARSFTQILQRHESLRTVFAIVNGQPVQRILPAAPFDLQTLDLRHLPPDVRAEKSRQLQHAEMFRPFDLAQGPLCRATLVRTDEEAYLLLISMHHIISDGWSLGVFLQEFQLLYTKSVTGQPLQLPALPVQYADFALWQRRWLQGEHLENQVAYWKKQLGNNPPVTELPVDFPRPPMQTANGANEIVPLPQELYAQLQKLSRETGSTLFMTLLALFKTLIYRYTGQLDLSVGTPVANRKQSEIEHLIGFFINTLVLRTEIKPGMTWRQFLNRLNNVALEAYAHQDVPFELLVEELQPRRDASRHPFFQLMFILQNAPMQQQQLPGLTAEPLFVTEGTAKFDLTLTVWEAMQKGPTLFFEYNTDLFAPETIQRLAKHYLQLAQTAVTHPDLPLSQMGLLTEKEKTTLLHSWNQTRMTYNRHACLHHLFRVQAEATPAETAVRQANTTLTYQQLDQRANQLAHYLQAQDVQPDDRVGIFMQRTPDLLVALLGILKAGAAYVPLDPAFPTERLAFMAADASVKVLLTQEALLENRPTAEAPAICLDRDWVQIAAFPETAVSTPVTADNLAYVIYTSGSTGKPKGVAITHRSVVNFLLSMQKEPGCTSADTLLAVTTLSFDIAVLELYLPLISGGQVVLASSGEAADAVQLAQLIHSSGATMMQATPATWRMLLDSGWRRDSADSPRPFAILCGGEALPRELADQLLAQSDQVWNLYGPTECTVWSTIRRVAPGVRAVSIGRPIANTQIYILDQNLQPVPVGVTGDLYIGGDGLAREYLGRPQLTAEKFIPDPYGNAPGARLYHTGDLARYLPTGDIDFLGRSDFQVKVRGFRIELGEIEAALVKHTAVQQAVVTAREASAGDARLTAYLRTNAEEPPSVSALRDFLHDFLPDYMIPSHFLFLDRFPLTPNNKVDRRVLPAPDNLRPDLAAEFVPPESEVEQIIAELWRDALQLEVVGVNDNFFDLGGHSLLLVKVHNQLQQQIDTNLTIAELFQYPTIQTLSRYLADQHHQPNRSFDHLQERAAKRKAARQQRLQEKVTEKR